MGKGKAPEISHKRFMEKFRHGFLGVTYVILVCGALVSLGLIYWLLYNIQL